MAIEVRRRKPATAANSVGFWQRLNAIEIVPRKVSDKERMFFTERLALLVETGNTLHDSLVTLAGQTDNPVFADIIKKMGQEISGGLEFSQALAKYPKVFNPVYINLISASEKGGFMADVLKELLLLEEKRAELRSTVIGALSYPAFLAVFSVLVVIFVLTVVFPKFSELFASIADELPATTIFLMGFSDALRQHYILITGSLIGAVGLACFALQRPAGRAWLDKLKLTAPVVRHIVVQIYLVQMMRVMSLSLKKDVSVQDTLQSCSLLIDNSVFRDFVQNLQDDVYSGKGIALGFNQSNFIPVLVKQMISTGEESASLSLVTGRMADFYERDLGKRLATLSKLAEPIMLMVMGVVVGFLVSSLLLPIFKLSSAVR